MSAPDFDIDERLVQLQERAADIETRNEALSFSITSYGDWKHAMAPVDTGTIIRRAEAFYEFLSAAHKQPDHLSVWKQSYEDYTSDEPYQHGIPDGLTREQYEGIQSALGVSSE